MAQTHNSVPRNDLVSQAFYICNLIEKWGTGTNKMIDLCLEQNLPPPEFTEYSDGLSIVFRFKEPTDVSHTSQPLVDTLSARQKEIVAILKTEGFININSIVNRLKEHIPERTLRHELSSLKKRGILKTVGSARHTLWGIDPSIKEDIIE